MNRKHTAVSLTLILLFQAALSIAQPPGDPEFEVSADSTLFVGWPDIDMTPDGRFVVAYSAFGMGPGGEAFARLYDSGGFPRGLPFSLAGDVSDPKVAVDSTGAFVVVWTSSHDAYQQRYDPDGTPLPTDPPIVNQIAPHLHQRVDGSPDVAMNDAGLYCVVWDSDGDQGDGAGVFARVLDNSGTPVTPVLQVNITPRWYDFGTLPRVGMDDNGNFVVAWHNLVALDWVVYARKFDALGNPLSTEFRVDTPLNPYQSTPATAMARDGKFVVIWRNNYATGNNEGMFARVFETDCSPVGPSFPLHTVVDSMIYFEPRVDYDGLGNFTALWTRRLIDGDPGSGELFFRQFYSDGTPVWPETQQPATDLASVTGVAAGEDGTFVIIWPGERSPRKLFGRRFPAQPVPVAFRASDIRAYADRIEISWDVFSDEALAGFQVYRSGLSHNLEIPVSSELLQPEQRSLVDRDIRQGETYTYVVVAVTAGGIEYRAPRQTVSVPVGSLTLEQNVPNPFNPQTTIVFDLPQKAKITLGVFDVRGHRVVVLANDDFPAGRHEIEWDGRDHRGNRLGSGVYFYRLGAGKKTMTRRMVLLK
jgi:hypothetical protein